MSGTRRKPGRLEPFVAGYRMWLAESGYMPGTIRNTLKVLGGLGRWMQDRDLEPAELTPAAIAEFRCFCRDHCLRHVPGMRSFECCWTSCDDRGHRRLAPSRRTVSDAASTLCPRTRAGRYCDDAIVHCHTPEDPRGRWQGRQSAVDP
jgi:hypothetical protein